jgi:hypothetical protein
MHQRIKLYSQFFVLFWNIADGETIKAGDSIIPKDDNIFFNGNSYNG